MHNYFCIKTANRVIKSYNKIVNIFDNYSKGKPLCKYIYIITKTNDIVFKPAKGLSYNFNPLDGILYACYEAALDTKELERKIISKVGFASDNNRDSIVNECGFLLQKHAGERLIISGTLYLEQSGTSTKFCGGDNKLAAALLGASPFPTDGFKLAVGENYMPSYNGVRDQNGIIESKSCQPKFLSNSISFEADFINPLHEVLLTLDSVPVIRCKPVLPENLVEENLDSQNDGFVNLENQFISQIFNLQVDNNNTINYSLVRVLDSAFRYRTAPYKLDSQAAVTCDPSCQIFALNSGGQITFYKEESGALIPFYYQRGKAAGVCQDKTMVVYLDNCIKLINQKESVINLNVSADSQTVFNNGNYLCVSLVANYLYIHKIDKNLNIATSYLDYGDKSVRLINMGHAVCVVASDMPIRVFTPFAEDTLLANWLNQHLAYIKNNLDSEFYFDGQRLVMNHANGEAYYIEYLSKNITKLDGKCRVLGGVVIKEEMEGKKSVAYDLGQNKRLFEIDGKIKDIFNKGDMLYVFLADGGFISYLVSSKKAKLVSSAISKNSSVRCYAFASQNKNGAIRISMTG